MIKSFVHVVILNGLPKNGKDSFREACTKFADKDHKVLYHSSIEVPKEILKRYFGWPGESCKDEFWRSALSKMKELWIETCEGPTCFCYNHINELTMQCREDGIGGFFFTDIREPEEIKKLVDACSALRVIGVSCTTVFIDKPDRIKHWGNPSDDSVGDYSYDFIIHNDGSITDLKEKAADFIKQIEGDR